MPKWEQEATLVEDAPGERWRSQAIPITTQPVLSETPQEAVSIAKESLDLAIESGARLPTTEEYVRLLRSGRAPGEKETQQAISDLLQEFAPGAATRLPPGVTAEYPEVELETEEELAKRYGVPSLGVAQVSWYEALGAYAKYMTRKVGGVVAEPVGNVILRAMGYQVHPDDYSVWAEVNLQRELKRPGFEQVKQLGGYRAIAQMGQEERGVADKIANFGYYIVGATPVFSGIGAVVGEAGSWGARLAQEAGLFGVWTLAEAKANGESNDDARLHAMEATAGYLLIGSILKGGEVTITSAQDWWVMHRAYGRAIEGLGLPKGATAEQVRSAFRARVLTEHPDLGGDPKTFQQLVEWHDFLTQPSPEAARLVRPPGPPVPIVPTRRGLALPGEVVPITPAVPPAEAPAKPTIMRVFSTAGHIDIPTGSLKGPIEQRLETIFNYGNPVWEGAPNQPGLTRSLSMGDMVKYGGKVWEVMPQGWEDVTGVSPDLVRKMAGELALPGVEGAPAEPMPITPAPTAEAPAVPPPIPPEIPALPSPAESLQGAALYVEGQGRPPKVAPGFVALPGPEGEYFPADVSIGPKEPITIAAKPRDIGPIQQQMSLHGAARSTGNPLVIKPVEDMIFSGVQMQTTIMQSEDQARAWKKNIPKQWHEKLFGLVESGETPEQIRARTDLPDSVKEAVLEAKQVHENSRLFIIDQKRQMWRAIFSRMPQEQLAGKLDEAGLPAMAEWSQPEIDKAADSLSHWMVPEDWGYQWAYMPHLFFGDYRLSATHEGEFVFLGRAFSPAEAYEKLDMARKATPGLADLKAEIDRVVPSDMTRVSRGRYWRFVQQLEEATNQDVNELREALRGVVGLREFKAKWYPALMERKGFERYEEDFFRAYAIGRRQFERWKSLTALNRQIQPQLDALRAKGLMGWADRIQQQLDYMWGRPHPMSISLDNAIAQTPILKYYVRPGALERWVSYVTGAQYGLKLTTARFFVVNTVQPETTLAPLFGIKNVEAARIQRVTKEGRAILRKYMPAFSSQWLEKGRFARRGRWMPQQVSEKSNQEVSFLTTFNHAKSLDMSDTEAQRYAIINGMVRTQFYPATADTPKVLQHPIGRVLAQFKRYTIKNLELVASMVKEKNWTGLTRWLGVNLALGGLSWAWRLAKWGGILGGGAILAKWMEDNHKWLEERYGKRVANLVHYGLPGLLGIDISGSISLLDVPTGANIFEMFGRAVTGPTVQDAYDIYRAWTDTKAPEPNPLKRVGMTILQKNRIFSVVEEIARAVWGEDGTYRDARGQKRYKKPLGFWSRVLRGASFRTTDESDYSRTIEAMREVAKARDKAIDEAVAARRSGKDPAEVIDDWNRKWPDFRIGPVEVSQRAKARERAAEAETIERIQAPKRVKRQFREEESE